MLVENLLEELGYSDSPFFLKKGTKEFATASGVGHIFRAATKPECSLLGVYTLNDPENAASTTAPVVYVCKAKTEAAADEIHRLVWNQDIVPFLIVYTLVGVKCYSGFEYAQDGTGHLSKLLSFNEASRLAKEFHSDEINSGRLWSAWSKRIKPQCRVNWRLLENLKNLDKYLRKACEVSTKVSHALIGKYVYLNYLRDRGILSDRKLESWGVSERDIFGSSVSVSKLKIVLSKLEDWLNGNIFPLSLSGPTAPDSKHVKLVAGVFNGDDVLPSGERQLSLDFKAYDFSYIPIETLSVVYEQFLHTPDEDGKSKGKEEGAYYTPIPVVNYMLGELEQTLPLEDGVRVLDPACGSGAFLVQCYRRLIEKTYPQHRHKTVHPIQLRELLVKNIFGLDRDPDACAVTELSLLLTLLDYVNPPDLEDDKRIKLPTLRDKNIFASDFFDPIPAELLSRGVNNTEEDKKQKRGRWIVGNPPWKKLNPRKLSEKDRPAWEWMQDKDNLSTRPVGGNELARAFAWRVADLADDETQIGLFLPAMTLFDMRAEDFRRKFFQTMSVHTIANFSNMAEVLSAGRFRVPAASIFYKRREEPDDGKLNEESIKVFSPLVANQEVTRPEGKGERIESWCIVINESEIRDIYYSEVVGGSSLPWKIATWGSHYDVKLLRRLSRTIQSLGEMQSSHQLVISEGPALRKSPVSNGEYSTVYAEELVGKQTLNTTGMARYRYTFSFPDRVLIENNKYHISKRAGVKKKLFICKGPTVIVGAARTFAVFTSQFFVVPARQIGIRCKSDNDDLLKALSLYLSSDFAFYHQFFTASQFGVKRDVATLDALKQMPCPLAEMKRSALKPWVSLHKKLVKTTPRRIGEKELSGKTLFDEDDGLRELLLELNDLVYDSLGITQRERILVSDFVNIRLELNDGKVGRPAVETPKPVELKAYAKRLQTELDEFVGTNPDHRHSVEVIHDAQTGMICVDFVPSKKTAPIVVSAADSDTAAALATTRKQLQEEIGQWIYFNRDLRVYDGMKTYLFKPMQRFHWTESQAMIDASEIIAETVSHEGAIE